MRPPLDDLETRFASFQAEVLALLSQRRSASAFDPDNILTDGDSVLVDADGNVLTT